ncbi:MAG: ribosomal protein S18-alanine N-acetyltransferase [Syntrophorhabdaceae bacterium]|nr:ribosomal protein S18-alanine N-acetyltransferase [Syntrophorhabdaceae bacterium]
MTVNSHLNIKVEKNIWNIRDMTSMDLDDIIAIEKKSFPTPWTKTMFLESLSSEIYKNLVIEENAEIIGYIMLYYVMDEAHITNFAIKPSFRRKGYGAKLLSYVIDYFKEKGVVEFFLEVRESNKAAINLYRKFGFEIVGKRRRYYSDTNEDAFIMHLSLRWKKDKQKVRLAG